MTARRKQTTVRKRAPRKQAAAKVEQPRLAGTVEDATRETLRAAEVEHSPLGQSALVLAKQLDHPADDEKGSGLAALARELRTTLAAATAGVQPKGDPVDEVARKRAERRARAARNA